MRLPILLDTDPGIDDAVAIAVVILTPELNLQLMTTVAGNASAERTARSALQLLHSWNAEIPLARGAAVSLIRTPRDVVSMHDESETTGHDFVEHNRKPLGIPAFLAIRDALMRVPEPAILVAISPLTNIALLLSQCLECKPYIRRLVIMGGFVGYGNYMPNTEFNTAADPEIAVCVLRSGIEIVMCGLNVTDQAILAPNYLSMPPQLNHAGKMLHALFNHYRSDSIQSGLRMYDPCTIVWLVYPSLSTPKPCFVATGTQGEFTSGATAVDIDGCLGKPANVQVTLDLDVKGSQQWVAEVPVLVS